MKPATFRDAPARPTAFGVLVPPDPAWPGLQEPEEILFPDLPIVDAHHHLWEAPGLSKPGFRYLLGDFLQDIRTGHNVVGSVYADCQSMYATSGPEHLRPVGETEFALGVSAMSRSGVYGPTGLCAGIVAYADLDLGDAVAEVLAAHVQAGNGRLKGIRNAANWDADARVVPYQPNRRANILSDPKIRSGLRQVRAHGLVYDSWAFFTQLPELAAMADALPDLQIVMNHCGGPLGYGPYATNRAEHFARWRSGVIAVARRPNVVCKLGGILGRGAAYNYLDAASPPSSTELAQAWLPWFETCIETFGPARCMFESNFPVEKLGTGYAVLWNTFKRIASAASDDERRAMFAGTAQRIYRLNL